MGERWFPKIGDAVQTPDGPGELIGFADGSSRLWRWGSTVVEGPYVVHLTDGLVRGYTFDQVRVERLRQQLGALRTGNAIDAQPVRSG